MFVGTVRRMWLPFACDAVYGDLKEVHSRQRRHRIRNFTNDHGGYLDFGEIPTRRRLTVLAMSSMPKIFPSVCERMFDYRLTQMVCVRRKHRFEEWAYHFQHMSCIIRHLAANWKESRERKINTDTFSTTCAEDGRSSLTSHSDQWIIHSSMLDVSSAWPPMVFRSREMIMNWGSTWKAIETINQSVFFYRNAV